MDDDWTRSVIFKCDRIVDAIRENRGEIIVYSDVDIQFFGPVKESILKAMKNREVACQLDSPAGILCTGFFAVRANDATLAVWQEVRRRLEKEKRDQKAFNRILQKAPEIRFGHLPTQFFGPGTFLRQSWRKLDRFYIPLKPLMFHANWVVGVENKLLLHRRAREVVKTGRYGILANNLMCLAHAAFRDPRGVKRAILRRSNPS
ncbi:MAG: putative nucleotide-diphospho-sugar transferase [Gammaproteobacteria bacterium]|nr:putative nucleotide-diphospho-sugar transferase [Gammaproteobacteria bacterium]